MMPLHDQYKASKYLFNQAMASSSALCLAVTAIIFVLGICIEHQSANAQSVDIRLDSAISSGIIAGPDSNERQIKMNRSPLLLDIDVAFIFDGDESVEWVLGTLVQAEYTASYAINPQVRIRRKWKLLEGFAGVGLPFFFTPYTRFGTELSLGVAFPAEGAIALIGHGVLHTYFLGSDLSDGNPVFTMNGAVGLRVRF